MAEVPKTAKAVRRRGTLIANTPASASQGEKLPYLSSVPAETALQGITADKTRWKQSSDGSYYYGDLARTYVALGDPRSHTNAAQQAATFTRVLDLDDSTAQTFLFVMARDLATPSDGPKSRIHVNELLEFKGYRRQLKGDFPPSVKREEQMRLMRLSDIWIGVNDEIRIKSGSRFRTKKIKLITRLIELGIEAEAGDSLESGSAMPLPTMKASVPYAFRAGLGEWASPYRTESTYMQTVLATIGQYDATRETQRYAMRIMIALMFNNTGVRTRWRLAELIEKTQIELPKHHADRFRQYVEDALDRLHRDGLILRWQYENANESALPGKRWLEKWLDWIIVIAIPGAEEEPAAVLAAAPSPESAGQKSRSGKRLSLLDAARSNVASSVPEHFT